MTRTDAKLALAWLLCLNDHTDEYLNLVWKGLNLSGG